MAIFSLALLCRGHFKTKKSLAERGGHRRVTTFEAIKFNDKAKHINCKTLIFYGELEVKKYPIIGERARLANKLIRDSTLIAVPGSGHDLTHPNYIEAIKKTI